MGGRRGDHSFLTRSCTPGHPRVIFWVLGLGSYPTSAGAQRDSPVWLHSTLLSFWSEKRRDKEEQGQKIHASCSLAQDPRSTLGSTLRNLVPPRCATTPHTPMPGLCKLRSWAWLAPAFTLAVFLQGHLPQLTAWVPDHEDLCSEEWETQQGGELRGLEGRAQPGPGPSPQPPGLQSLGWLSSQSTSVPPNLLAPPALVPAFGLGAARWARTPGRRQGSSHRSAAQSHSWAPVVWPQYP